MKMEECYNDPQFRIEFIKEYVKALRSIIDNNNNAIYYNKSSISILEEIKNSVVLTEEENIVINENLSSLENDSKDLNKQKDKLKTMSSICEKFLTYKKIK
ncbi:MAG: hypothetical protein WC088_05780 [Candidatus Izemoplasmatales bacterium]|jgi:hypothetical protein